MLSSHLMVFGIDFYFYYFYFIFKNVQFLTSFLFCFSKADFGVSAKNTRTIQRRDSFIGTPYW